MEIFKLQDGSRTVQQSGPGQVFAGWKVVVMGGSRGIGRAVALGFAGRSASVAVCGRSQQALEAVGEELAVHGQPFYVAACDVAETAAVEAFVTVAASAFGGLDVLVNCASALAPGNDAGAWSASVNVDLMGGLRALDAALPFLRRSGHASVINMASVAALKAVPARIAHGAMKAAVVHETASNALALAADGIRVNCVVPGSTEAPGGIWDRLSRANPELYRETLESIPLGRLATPDDIARVVFFLASSEAGWITGQSIVVDGGQSLSRPGA